MKFLVVVPFFLFLVRYAVIFFMGKQYEMYLQSYYQWIKFKMDYSKSFDSLKEELRHYEIFHKTLKKIDEHNRNFDAGLVSWKMGINQFSDHINHNCVDSYVDDDIEPKSKIQEHKLNGNAPTWIDWRKFNVVLRVRDQLSCCSSYAMAVVGAIESQNALKYKKKLLLSPRELMDCSVTYKNKRCNGGGVIRSFKYTVDKGLGTEKFYPYGATNGTCKSTKPIVNVTGFTIVPPNEKYLLDALGTVGPVVAVISTDKILGYKSGIFECSKKVNSSNQAVLLVGYGKRNGLPYWLIKMSWGTKWGDEGYVRIRRGNDTSQCGLFEKSKLMYPIVAPMI